MLPDIGKCVSVHTKITPQETFSNFSHRVLRTSWLHRHQIVRCPYFVHREGSPLYPVSAGYIFSEILHDRHRLRPNDPPTTLSYYTRPTESFRTERAVMMFCVNKIGESDSCSYLTAMSRSLKFCPCRMSKLLVATHSFRWL